MKWLRGYLIRCRLVFAAAWAYLRDGDERLFDLRLELIDERDPLRRWQLVTHILSEIIGERLRPALERACKAMSEFALAYEGQADKR